MRQVAELRCFGKPLDLSPAAFGALRASADAAHDAGELRRRMEEDGYLYLPGALDMTRLLAARRSVLSRLAAMDLLDPDTPLMEGIVKPGAVFSFMPELAENNPELDALLYDGEMMSLFERFLGGPVRHYDYTWLRAKSPGDKVTTAPHYDIVYMGRGTHDVCTAWTPLGDVPLEMGGLIVLEGSHKLEHVRETYGKLDVDNYCANHDDAARIESGELGWQPWVKDGVYSFDPVTTREELGGRWLSADYRAGDVLIFSMFTMHASMDNQTSFARLSTDSRYQRADEPADERWVGPNPPMHGPNAKRGMIC